MLIVVSNTKSHQKKESQLTNFIVHDLQTRSADKARPYNLTFYRSSNLAAKNNRDLILYEIEKSKKKTLLYLKMVYVLILFKIFHLNSKEKNEKFEKKLLNIIYTFMLIMDQDFIHW